MQKSTHKMIFNHMSAALLANMRAYSFICFNVVPILWLQIDVQSGSIPLECLSREVDYNKRTSSCHSAGADTPISLAFTAL